MHTHQRIYVLPTRLGVLLGALLLAMLLGGLNYNNNPALLLAFFLLALVLNSFVMTHLAISGVRIGALHAEPVHAGQTLTIRARLDAGARPRPGVILRIGTSEASAVDIAAHATRAVELPLPTVRRGRFSPGRLQLSSTQPLGLARGWSGFRPTPEILVYPAIETPAAPLPVASSEGKPKARPMRSGEDTHALRDYQVGDAPRNIAWKASARLDRLLVREYEASNAADVLLDWESLRGLDREQRISRLARWVVDAEREGRRSRLQLPGEVIGPARGAAHRHACLRALALLPEARA